MSGEPDIILLPLTRLADVQGAASTSGDSPGNSIRFRKGVGVDIATTVSCGSVLMPELINTRAMSKRLPLLGLSALLGALAAAPFVFAGIVTVFAQYSHRHSEPLEPMNKNSNRSTCLEPVQTLLQKV